jgi:uncharacterized protein (TIGR03435 family)
MRFAELVGGVFRIGDMGSSFRKNVLIVAALVAASLSVAAQSSAVPGAVVAEAKPISFGVASVRRNVSATESCDAETVHVTGDGFRMTRCPLIVALFLAYVPTDGTFMGFSTDGRMVGAPEWMKSELYDIDARVDAADRAAWQDPAKQKEMMHAMLQSLLKERCGLAVHREMRDKAVYALVVGKGGPKFSEAKSVEPAAILKEDPKAGAVPGGGGMFTLKGHGSVDFYAVPIPTLAVVLSNKAGRVVVDKTGLTGRYDIKLEMPQPGEDGAGGAQDPGTSIFTVVQEELGLKLESAKDPVETLVIDHAERPAEN